MRTTIIGIDPGDRWTGVAQLMITRTDVIMGTFVLDGKSRSLYEIVDAAIIQKPAYVVAEEYRARPIGHQRFNAPLTPRLLGALEYRAVYLGGRFYTTHAGSPTAVWSFPIGKFIEHWRFYWPKPRDDRWLHALSAWRVICTHIIQEQPQLFRLIDNQSVQSMILDAAEESSAVDLIAPFAAWPR
jgi:hypothetical protein